MEPWNIRSNNGREADTLITFIIFCEDETSEPIYFQFFETERIKINPIGGQKSKIDNVMKAINHCLNEGLMEYDADHTPKLLADNPIVWCVFDRDKESADNELQAGNTSFMQALQSARNGGIKVAWSNDSFELWVLLHFEPVDPREDQNHHRNRYYDRLTAIFRSLPKPSDDLAKCRSHASFSYRSDLKGEKHFRSIVRPLMVGGIKTAIERAKELDEHHPSTVLECEKMPCTMVYELVEELLHHGGKKLE